MDGDNRTETPEDVMMEAVLSDTASSQELAGKKPKAVAAEDHADPAKTDEHAEPDDPAMPSLSSSKRMLSLSM